MKVAFLIYSIQGGGAERVISTLANTFCKQNIETTVITYIKTEKEYNLSTEVSRKIIFQNTREITKYNRFIKRIKTIRNFCKSEKFDIIITFLGSSIIDAMIATIGLHTKIVFSIRSNPNMTFPKSLSTIIKKYIYSYTSGAIFQTDEALLWAPKKLRKKSKVIFNPIRDDFFLDNKSAINQNKIVTVGRLTLEKRHDILIKAIVLVKEKYPNIELFIYGDGPLMESDKALIEEYKLSNIYLKGRVDNIKEAIQDSAVFVLSSETEGMPNALMEAMALGLTCVSTDCPCGGPHALLYNSNAGILVPVNNEKALAEGIINVLTNKELARSLAFNARKEAKKYSEINIANEWIDFLKQIKYAF